jgi:hypothetical protein
VVPNEVCPTGSSSVAGLPFQFYSGGPYPPSTTVLFFADYSGDYIWGHAETGGEELPNP